MWKNIQAVHNLGYLNHFARFHSLFFYLVRVISVFLGSGADIRILLANSEVDAIEINLR